MSVLVCQLPIAVRAAGRSAAGAAGRLRPDGRVVVLVAGCAPFAPPDGVLALAPAVGLVLLLHAGEMTAVPVARDLVARLAGDRRLGAHFGVLASAGGAAVLVGSTGIGALLDLARVPGPAAAVPWLVLAALPAASAVGLWLLTRRIERGAAGAGGRPARAHG